MRATPATCASASAMDLSGRGGAVVRRPRWGWCPLAGRLGLLGPWGPRARRWRPWERPWRGRGRLTALCLPSSVRASPAAAAAVAAGAAGGGSWALGAPAVAAAPGAEGAGRRRMEKRVTARTKARASASRPMSEAPRTEAPSGRAVVSATGRPLTLLGVLEPDDGSSVGNRFPALPPGLSVELGVGTEVIPGRLPTGSGDVVVIGDVDGIGRGGSGRELRRGRRRRR